MNGKFRTAVTVATVVALANAPSSISQNGGVNVAYNNGICAQHCGTPRQSNGHLHYFSGVQTNGNHPIQIPSQDRENRGPYQRPENPTSPKEKRNLGRELSGLIGHGDCVDVFSNNCSQLRVLLHDLSSTGKLASEFRYVKNLSVNGFGRAHYARMYELMKDLCKDEGLRYPREITELREEDETMPSRDLGRFRNRFDIERDIYENMEQKYNRARFTREQMLAQAGNSEGIPEWVDELAVTNGSEQWTGSLDREFSTILSEERRAAHRITNILEAWTNDWMDEMDLGDQIQVEFRALLSEIGGAQ